MRREGGMVVRVGENTDRARCDRRVCSGGIAKSGARDPRDGPRGELAACEMARQMPVILASIPVRFTPRWARYATRRTPMTRLADLTHIGFYRKLEVRSRRDEGRRALLTARKAAIGALRNAENAILGLLASFGLHFPAYPSAGVGQTKHP